MGNFIFRKTVDQSLLRVGMTIPVESHQEILQQLGITLERGEKQNIAVRIAGSEYEASQYRTGCLFSDFVYNF